MLATVEGKLLAGSVIRERNSSSKVVGTKNVCLFEGL